MLNVFRITYFFSSCYLQKKELFTMNKIIIKAQYELEKFFRHDLKQGKMIQ